MICLAVFSEIVNGRNRQTKYDLLWQNSYINDALCIPSLCERAI